MEKIKRILGAIALLVVMAAAAGGAWWLYEGYMYFSTENASVSADMITITPEVTGKLKEWTVREGDVVKAGQVLGRQDLSMAVSSSAVSLQALSGTADAMVAKADIKTPIDGKIVQSSVVKGQVISPGMTAAVVADIGHAYIKANIEETDIFKIKAGQTVEVKIDAYPGKSFAGYVETIGQATQSAFNTFPSLNTSGEYSKVTQLIPVKINLTGAEGLTLMPGMNATVKVHIRQ